MTTFLIVARYTHALDWCREHDVSPLPRAVVIVVAENSDATYRLRGRTLKEGDEIVEAVVYSHLSKRGWETLGAIEQELEIMRRHRV